MKRRSFLKIALIPPIAGVGILSGNGLASFDNHLDISKIEWRTQTYETLAQVFGQGGKLPEWIHFDENNWCASARVYKGGGVVRAICGIVSDAGLDVRAGACIAHWEKISDDDRAKFEKLAMERISLHLRTRDKWCRYGDEKVEGTEEFLNLPRGSTA